MRGTKVLRVVIAIVALAIAIAAQAAAQVSTPSTPTASSTEGRAVADGQSARVKRLVLPDGTIQFTYPDGTTRLVESTLTQSSAETGTPPAAANKLPPEPPPPWLTDAATNRAFLESEREYYMYKASGLRYRSRVFEWQLFSSRIIFTTVILLVTSGIVFAAIQFRAGLKRPRAAASDVATEIDLSTSSVKVSSPVLGVIILVISLAFFYLYLVYVYPISEVV
jgi:hypothetical protein